MCVCECAFLSEERKRGEEESGGFVVMVAGSAMCVCGGKESVFGYITEGRELCCWVSSFLLFLCLWVLYIVLVGLRMFGIVRCIYENEFLVIS